MKFETIIRAIDPLDGELKTWSGPIIESISWGMAEQYLQQNLPYCKVHGILHSTLPEEGKDLQGEQISHSNN